MRYTYLFRKRIYLVIDEPAFSLATFFYTYHGLDPTAAIPEIFLVGGKKKIGKSRVQPRKIEFSSYFICVSNLTYIQHGGGRILVISQVANSPRGIALLETFLGTNWIPRIVLIYFGRLLHDSFAMNSKFVSATSTQICNQSTLIDESYE